jgi:hypothetical protein
MPLFQPFLSPSGNLLINGGFDLHQRQAPGTLTARSNDTYGPDCWNILTQTASVQNQRSTGNVSVNDVLLKQNQASAQRLGIMQMVEGVNSVPFRSRTMRFQTAVKISNSQAVRIALLEWTGTLDSITSNVVASWTSSTYTAGNFFLASSVTPTAVDSLTPSGATWTTIAVSGTVSSSCNNLMVFVWTEGTAAQNVTLELAEAGLYDGAASRDWLPRPFPQEFQFAERYYEKTCGVDVDPTGGGAAGATMTMTVINNTTANGVQYGQWPYQVAKRANPTVTIRPYTTPANTGRVSDNSGNDLAASSGVSVGSAYYLAVQNNSGGNVTTGNNLVLFGAEADASL